MVGEWLEKVEYPQAPVMLQEDLIPFLQEGTFARLGSINEDGTVHMTPIYYRYEDGDIIMATQAPSRKIRNIKRNNHVTVLIDKTEPPYRGVLIYGRARLDYDNIIAQRVAIFEKTMSRENGEIYANKLCSKWECVIVRVTPEHIATFDYTRA